MRFIPDISSLVFYFLQLVKKIEKTIHLRANVIKNHNLKLRFYLVQIAFFNLLSIFYLLSSNIRKIMKSF